MGLKDFINENGATIIIILLVAVLSFIVIDMNIKTSETAEKCSYCENLEKYGDRMGLYDPENYRNVKVEGVYFVGKKYFCVWAENRSREDIQQTVCHEDLHYLIDDGDSWTHFCNRTGMTYDK